MSTRSTRGVVPAATVPATTTAPTGATEQAEDQTETMGEPTTSDNPLPPELPQTMPVADESITHPHGIADSSTDVPANAAPPSPQELIELACKEQEGTVYLCSTHPTDTSDGTMYDPYAKLYYYPGKATPTPFPLSSWMQLQLRAGLIAICKPDHGVRARDPSSFNRPETGEDEIDE